MPHSGAGSRARRVACYAELPRITRRTCLKRGWAEAAGVYLDLTARSKRTDGAILVPREATFWAPQGLFRQFLHALE
jgi:hypothetical protein